MRSIFRRTLCALLCLSMLVPTLAFADQDASGLRFHLGFQMDGAAFPREQQPLMSSLAELVNIITLEGTLESSFTGCFDLNTILTLGGQDSTRTSLRVFGTESAWGINSSLLGDETLFINLVALLEFSMKAYFHLDIPLQRLALLASPYVHTSALDSLTSAWRQTMLAQSGPRTITRQQTIALAREMADIANGDRAFQFWVQALTMEAGYDETVAEALMDLPAWAESFVAEDGITIAQQGATETWRTGDVTLLTRTVEDTVSAWSLALPATTNGYAVSARYAAQPTGEEQLQLTITDDAEATVLALSLQAEGLAGLKSWQLNAPLRLRLDVSGEAMARETHLLLEGQEENGMLALSLLNAETRQPQLTLSGTVQHYTPDKTPEFTNAQLESSFNLLSMNDVTLTELLSRIGSPMLEGILPLLTRVPVNTMQSLMDLLEEHQVLNLLLNGGAAADDEAYFDD